MNCKHLSMKRIRKISGCSYCHRGCSWSQATIEYRNEKLKAAWSPEQIACTPCGLKSEPDARVPPVISAAALGVRAVREIIRGAVPIVVGVVPASSLVCFCITCQDAFVKKAAFSWRSCAARISRTARRHHAPGRKRAPGRTCVRRSARTPTHLSQRCIRTATAPPAADPVFHNLHRFSTFSPVFHSGFLSLAFFLRETG